MPPVGYRKNGPCSWQGPFLLYTGKDRGYFTITFLPPTIYKPFPDGLATR